MKVAVSIPDPIFEAADRLAKERNLPRSQLFAEALAEYLEVRGAEAITASLNEIYGQEPSRLDKELQRAQYRSIAHETW